MSHERWEYKVVDVSGGLLGTGIKAATLTEMLGKEGQQGWELVSVTQDTMHYIKLFLKRPR